tara:strand:- start:815 stop:1324 length:510 start_codon:yes stop_codon:yes gene_type:complete
MEYEFDVTVSERDAEVALRRFIFRGAGWGTLVAAVCCIGYVVYDFSAAEVGLFSVAIMVLLGLLVLVFLAAWFVRRRQMADLLKRLGDAPIFYVMDDEGFSVESPLGGSHLKWEAIQKVWIDPDLLMMFYAKNGYITIPMDQVPDGSLGLVVDQVKANKGKVLDKRKRG